VQSDHTPNSDASETLKTLVQRIKPQVTDKFLEDLLNLDVSDERRVNVFWRRFADFLPTPPVTDRDKIWLDWRQRQLRTAWTQPTVLDRELALLSLVPTTSLSKEVAELMGKIEPDLDFAERTLPSKWTFKIVDPTLIPREYLEPNLARIREYVQEFGEKAEIPGVWIYRESPAFALVLLRALHLADRMRHCPNPACPAPYFIARRRSQKYCSDACALPAQREFKALWWKNHGTEWQRERRAKAKRGSRKSQRKGGK
jgi:hypothetical protein